MGRKPNDGRGRLGGRKAGTPNSQPQIKVLLRQHSMEYYTPSIPAEEAAFLHDKNGVLPEQFAGKIFSQFDLDLLCMKAADRVKAEIDILKFHTPQMQASSIDMAVMESNKTLADRLRRLNNGEEISSDNDE